MTCSYQALYHNHNIYKTKKVALKFLNAYVTPRTGNPLKPEHIRNSPSEKALQKILTFTNVIQIYLEITCKKLRLCKKF